MRGRDIATAIINRSIDYKNMTGNEKYYSNFYSVNKLMYFAYCEYLKQKESSLIRESEKIIADSSGSFFESTLFIFKDYNFDDVKEKINHEFLLPKSQEYLLPQSIKELIDKIVKEYGTLSNQEIGILAKKDEAYLEACGNKDKIITNEIIMKYIYKEPEKIKSKKI